MKFRDDSWMLFCDVVMMFLPKKQFREDSCGFVDFSFVIRIKNRGAIFHDASNF